MPDSNKDGFTIACNNCGEEDTFTVEGKSGYGVTILCGKCGNKEDIFW